MVEKGQRTKLGRFAPGHAGGPGRKPGISLKKLAAQRLEADGGSLADALWKVLESLLASAQSGDVLAARLVLDRLAEAEVEPPKGISIDGLSITVVTGVPARRPATAPRPKVTYEPILGGGGILPSLGVHAPHPKPEPKAVPVPVKPNKG